MNFITDIHTHKITDSREIKSIISIDIRKPFTPVGNQLYSVGIHPWYADKSLLPIFKELAILPQVALIGECGLDKLTATSMNLQKEIFEKHIEMSEKIKKPLIIHCVKAYNELMEIRKHTQPIQPWIIHGFRGKKKLAEQLLNNGFFLSFGWLYNTEALKAAWNAGRMLIETDDNDINIREVYRKIADELSVTENEISNRSANLRLLV